MRPARVVVVDAAMISRLRQNPMCGRVVRCFGVSIGSTVLTAFVIIVLALGFGVPGGYANVAAVLISTGPSYFANRRWVWGVRERSNYARQVAPFWALSISGLILSTIAVGWMDRLSTGWPPAFRAFALPFANLAVYGALWIVQFALLECVIFRDRATGDPPPAGARSRTTPDRAAA